MKIADRFEGQIRAKHDSPRRDSPYAAKLGDGRVVATPEIAGPDKNDDAVRIRLKKVSKESEIIDSPVKRRLGGGYVPPVDPNLPVAKVPDAKQLSPHVGAIPEPRAGDANLDGLVDEADLKILQKNLFTVGGRDRGDFNGDGLIDGSDFNIWNENRGSTSTNPEPRAGDANLDGLVDETDLKILHQNLFTAGGRDRGDFNGDGLIDGSDFNIWNENRGSTSGTNGPANPETPVNPLTTVVNAVAEPLNDELVNPDRIIKEAYRTKVSRNP